jgi:hypothetical protein
MSVVRTIYANMPLGQDTRRCSRDLRILLDLQRNISYYHSWKLKKHVQERSCTERIMAATFGRLLRSVGFLLYLCWSVKLSVKQNGSWGTCKIINYLRFWYVTKNVHSMSLANMRIVKWNLTIGSVPMHTLSLLWFYPSLIYRVLRCIQYFEH